MPWKLLLFGDDDEPGDEPKDTGWRTDDPESPSAYWREEKSEDNSDRASIWDALFGSDDEDNN